MKKRTIDEIAHETGAALLPEMPFGQRTAVVVVSELTGEGGNAAVRTVWRFIHCNDPKVQALTLRQIADLIEQAAKQPLG